MESWYLNALYMGGAPIPPAPHRPCPGTSSFTPFFRRPRRLLSSPHGNHRAGYSGPRQRSFLSYDMPEMAILFGSLVAAGASSTPNCRLKREAGVQLEPDLGKLGIPFSEGMAPTARLWGWFLLGTWFVFVPSGQIWPDRGNLHRLGSKTPQPINKGTGVKMGIFKHSLSLLNAPL